MQQQTEKVWTEFSTQLKQFILSRIVDKSQADDILQEVFIKIHSRLDTLRESDKIQSWIYQIARNAIIDYYRTHTSIGELPHSLAAPEPDPIEEAKQEHAPHLLPMIQNLPEHYRQAVMLSEIEGLTQKEVAAKLGLSVSGAKSRVQRGRAMLKQMIMGCCHFEFDHRGIPMDYEPKKGTPCGQCQN